jgi:hypothetical protein
MPDRQDDLNPGSDLAPFADALKRLAPQPAHLSRDALLFEAGKAAASSRLPPWAWPAATAVFAGLSLVLAAFLVSPSDPVDRYVDRVVYVPQPGAGQPKTPDSIEPPQAPKTESPRSTEDMEKMRMLQVRRDVLRWGVDMLPDSKSAKAGPSQDVAAAQLRHWLNLPQGTYAYPAVQPKKPAPKDDDDDQ